MSRKALRMRRYGAVLVSALGFFLSGCMVGPRYAKPTVPLTTNFEETEKWKRGDGWKVAQPGDDLIRGKWWELYGDAMLNEIEEQVDPSNQDLKIAEANLRQARAAIRFSRASQAPTIGSSPSISDIRASATNLTSHRAQSTMAAEISFFLLICRMRSTCGGVFAAT